MTGLKFDGVDDQVNLPKSIYDLGKFTALIDFTVEKNANEQGIGIYLGGGIYIHRQNNKIYIFGSTVRSSTTYEKGRHKVAIVSTGRTISSKLYDYKNGVLAQVTENLIQDIPITCRPIEYYGSKIIHKFVVYNRPLTDTEIQQLLEE